MSQTTDADIDAMARLDFEPVARLAESWAPPTNPEWTALANPHLISVRLAWLTLQKTKAELMNMAGELGDDVLMELVGQLGQSADWFEGMHRLLASAECRIMCAYAAAASPANPG